MKNLSSIQPNIRLVDNIGFDESATHTNTKILKLETDNYLNMEDLKRIIMTCCLQSKQTSNQFLNLKKVLKPFFFNLTFKALKVFINNYVF